MAVVIDEMTTVPAATPAERGGESAAGGGGGESKPSEHDIEKLVELRASRSERIRAY